MPSTAATIEFHHLIHVEGQHASSDGHAHCVAHEVCHVVVLQEVRILGKDGALVRTLDVSFNRHHAVLARLAEKIEHHLQRFKIALLGIGRSLEHTHQTCDEPFENMHGVRYDQRSQCGTTNGYQFRRLDQDSQLPLFHQETADNCAEDH